LLNSTTDKTATTHLWHAMYIICVFGISDVYCTFAILI